MSKIKDGRRPAFPAHGPFEPGIANTSYAYPGMTLRDYFAAKALAGLTSACDEGGNWTAPDSHITAVRAYAYADAMLAAREASE